MAFFLVVFLKQGEGETTKKIKQKTLPERERPK
jgi:hypothetical protein